MTLTPRTVAALRELADYLEYGAGFDAWCEGLARETNHAMSEMDESLPDWQRLAYLLPGGATRLKRPERSTQ